MLLNNNIHDGPSLVPKYYQCDICHFVYLTLKGMRIHRVKCVQKIWWKEKMMMMTSCNEVTTCEDISREYALSVGQSVNKSNYPTMPKSMMTSCKEVNTCEDISREYALSVGQSANKCNYPTMPKSQPNKARRSHQMPAYEHL